MSARLLCLSASVVSVAAFGVPAITTCPPSPPSIVTEDDVYFIETLGVTANATNGALVTLIQSAVHETMYKAFVPGPPTVVDLYDNGNLNNEWYLTYDTLGNINGGRLLQRFKNFTNLLVNHIPPDPDLWWAGRNPNPPNDGRMMGAIASHAYNLPASVAPLLTPYDHMLGDRTWGKWTCDIKGRNANSDVMTVVYAFSVNSPGAASDASWNTEAPKVITMANDEPGTIGMVFYMLKDNSGYFTSGTVISTLVSMSAYENHVKLINATWTALQTPTAIDFYNVPTHYSLDTSIFAGNPTIINWGPRFAGYPVCGF